MTAAMNESIRPLTKLCILISCLISSSHGFQISLSLSRRRLCTSRAQSTIRPVLPATRPSSLILRSSTPQNQSFSQPTPPTAPPPLDLHPTTISAISSALLLRSQNNPSMPLRIPPNSTMEPWEITLTAGKIAQPAVEAWRDALPSSQRESVQEEMDVMAGRMVATISRLEELEGELVRRCENCEREDWKLLGVPDEEMGALQRVEGGERVEKAMAAVDAACLFDDMLRYNRAKAVFALFLRELEGPGLRANKVVLPCMEVDFLGTKEWEMLFGSKHGERKEKANVKVPTNSAVENSQNHQINEADRPSLHPLAIEAIEESFRLRAQNSTTSPLRIIDSSTEFYEVEYSAMKFADRFLQQHSKPNDDGKHTWTEEELHTIGGRIVGVIMRMEDLEWEWNHRVATSSLGGIVPDDKWKRTLGLHPGSMEQECLRTVDLALLDDSEFARKRAEMMYAMFLMNVEEPAVKASGGNIIGGSSASDFISDSKFIDLMMPRLKN